MTLAKRIIPCLDVDQGKVVKGIKFLGLKTVGDPAELGKYYSDEGADELVFLDVTASVEKRGILIKAVRRVAETISIPFTVGGGIGSVEEARDILLSGADKVSVNTAAIETPDLVRDLSERFGRQCVVVAIDAKRNFKGLEGKRIVESKRGRLWYEAYTYGGRKYTGVDALWWAQEVERLGAGELLVTSMDEDGTKDGYEIELYQWLSGNVNIPVIASGGAGYPKHILEVLVEGKADAALAASIFHYQEYPVPVVKRYLRSKGVNVRFEV